MSADEGKDSVLGLIEQAHHALHNVGRSDGWALAMDRTTAALTRWWMDAVAAGTATPQAFCDSMDRACRKVTTALLRRVGWCINSVEVLSKAFGASDRDTAGFVRPCSCGGALCPMDRETR